MSTAEYLYFSYASTFGCNCQNNTANNV